MRYRFVSLLAALILCGSALAQQPHPDTLLAKMSVEQKLGQLFMVAAWSDTEHYNKAEIDNLINQYYIGGVIFFKGSPAAQAVLTNSYQQQSRIPLFIAIDGEWGLSMRLDSTFVFPRQMTMGGLQEDILIREVGRQMGLQCREMGIHINFAPVVDVNNNPLNPVINDRSFGENRDKVARKGILLMQGMQETGVIACAKHFPGHGDTETDSHYGLPLINFGKTRLDTQELYPFREIFKAGVKSVMVAHLFVTALDTTANTASSISPGIVTGLLQKEMGFKGLIFTDALNMKGVANFNTPGELELKALQAGNDILLYPENVPAAVERLKRALDNGEISMALLDQKVRKILQAKVDAGVFNQAPVNTDQLTKKLNPPSLEALNNQIFRQSVCLVKNEDQLIPLHHKPGKKIALVAIGKNNPDLFKQALERYCSFDYFVIEKTAGIRAADSIFALLDNYSQVVVVLHQTSRFVKKNYGITETGSYLVGKINDKKPCVLVDLGNPYNLSYFPGIRNLIVAYEDTELPNRIAAEILAGAVSPEGILPVSTTEAYAGGHLMSFPANKMLYQVHPFELGADMTALSSADSLIENAIRQGAMPGCQVLAAKDGKVFYNKSFGKFTYEDSLPVTESSMYDIASVTKVMSTTLAVMKLYEEGKIRLDEKISYYLKEFRKTDKKNLTIRQLLTHTSGLPAFIPFYKETLDSTKYAGLYSKYKEGKFNVQVADSLWLEEDYPVHIWKEIIKAQLKEPGKYVYSDLNFIILGRIVEKISGEELDQYVVKNFYEPMGLSSISYNPLNHGYPLSRLVPTENDQLFRKQVIRGYVHDPAAAMLGGVAGHAGLFSNAWCLANIAWMLQEGGVYNNHRYLQDSTVRSFTMSQSLFHRRGLGFDRPELPGKDGPTAASCSQKTFGHTGFTGTGVWVDPKSGILFVFLSNRIYPDAENKKLVQMNVRTQLQELIYRSIIPRP